MVCLAVLLHPLLSSVLEQNGGVGGWICECFGIRFGILGLDLSGGWRTLRPTDFFFQYPVLGVGHNT